ncbi:MAG: diguanylate cyclase [Nitrospirae bacterium]|nr:diguanylate cyclase [Nitrospirota bacterium]
MRTDTCLLDPVPWGCCVADENGVIRHWNQRLVQWTGLPPARVLGKTLFSLFPRLDERRVRRRILATAATGAPAHFSPVLLPQFFPAQGAQAQVQQATVVRTRTEGDGGAELLITVADVTEYAERAARYRSLKDLAAAEAAQRHMVEQALRQSETMLKDVLDAIPVRVFWKDTDSRYLGCNDHFARDAGLDSPGRIVGLSDDDLIWAHHADRYREDDRRVMSGATRRVDVEEPSQRSDGGRWLQTTKVPLTGPDGAVTGVLGCYADITERRRAQTEREQLIAELSELRQRLEIEVVTDPLSGALNRRGMNAELHRAVAAFGRWRNPFAVVLADMDHFKRVNDTHGHEAGDLLIRGVADTLRLACRETDIVARWGGEEFLLLLPATQAAGAGHLMERLRVAVENARWPFQGRDLGVTVSLGAACFDAEDGDLEAIIQAADQALYEAKAAGRNRWVVKSPGGEAAPAPPWQVVDAC